MLLLLILSCTLGYFGVHLVNYLIDFILAKILFQPSFEGLDRQDRSLISKETDDAMIEEIEIKTKSGVVLRSLYTKAKTNIDIKHRKCILYSHGNMGNIYGENKKEHMLRKIVPTIDVITYDYKGYGKNLGKSVEKSIYNDITTVWNYMVFNLKYKPKNIILYGYSLGCVPTLWLGSNLYTCNHIVVQAGFSSLEDVVKEVTLNKNLQYICKMVSRYAFYNKFNNVRRIKLIKNIPITVFHSVDDELIPFECINTLKNANRTVNICKTMGSHSVPIYDEHAEETLKQILS